MYLLGVGIMDFVPELKVGVAVDKSLLLFEVLIFISYPLVALFKPREDRLIGLSLPPDSAMRDLRLDKGTFRSPAANE